MGLLDRIGKVGTGLGGALWAPVGLVKDLAVGAFTDDDEFDGFVGTLYGSVTKRGGRMLGAALGPEEGLGAAIGGLPGAVRAPARSVINPVLEGLETAGREAIREPLTALMTAASLQQAGQGFDLGEGYRIAQERSLGQAVALAFLTKDITDEAEVAEAMGSDWYQSISGTMDAATRLFLDVDVIGGKFLRGARRATVTGKAAERTVRLGRVGEKLKVGPEITIPAGGLEQLGAAAARHAPEWMQARGIVGRTISNGADVEAALNHPSLGVINERIGEIKAEAGIGVPPVAVEEVATGPADVARRAQANLGTRADEIDDIPKLMQHWVSGADASTEIRTIADELLGGRPPTTAFDRQVAAVLEQIPDAPVSKQPLFRGLNASARTEEFIARAVPGAEIDFGLSSAATSIESATRYATSSNTAVGAVEGARPAVLELRGVRAVGPGEVAGGASKLDPASDALGLAGRYGNVDKVERLTYGKFRVVEVTDDPAGFKRIVLEQVEVPPPGRAGAAPPTAAVPATSPTEDPAAIDRAAARIRDLAFHDHRHGAVISRVLAESDDLNVAWGAVMGHKPSIEALHAAQPDVAGRLSRLQGDQARIAEARRGLGTLGDDGQLQLLPDDLAAVERSQLNAEIDALYDVEAVLAHNATANAMVRELPRISATSRRRAQITRSAFFMGGPDQGLAARTAAAPLRLLVNMRPRNFVDLHDAAGDAQVTRLLRKARLPLEEQDRLRGAYMAAADPTARNAVLAEVEKASIRQLAARHGITDPAQIDELINKAENGRNLAMSEIQRSRRYTGVGEGSMMVIDDIGDDGLVTQMHLPVPIAVTQEFNHYLLPDLDQIDRVLARHGERISRPGAAKDFAVDTLEAYQRLWKPSVLLRVGWPIRVVGEEQVRIMSQIGALLTLGKSGTAATRYLGDAGIDALNNLTQAWKGIPRAERTFGKETKAGAELTRAESKARRGVRLGTAQHRGVAYEASYGTNATFQNIVKAQNSAQGTINAVMESADDLRTGMRTEVMGEWQSLDPTTRGYAEGWEHAVNNQIGKDEMWRQFVEGKTLDEVRDWVDTPEGRRYLRRVPHWKNRIDDWLDVAKQTVDEYLPSDELRSLALEGKAKHVDLERLVPDAAGRPTVHGAVVADIQGRSRIGQALTKTRDKVMKTLGTTPTDVLSRNPYFDHHYHAEMRRLINVAADQGVELATDMVTGLEKQARSYALGESKKLLYDLADESELAHMLRFVVPFYSAWQEVLTRWTGIAVENPAFVARMHEIWRAPERMGIVTDENGATIREDGTATSALGEKVEAGKDRYVNMRLLAGDNVTGKALFNDLTKHFPGVKRLENAKFNKESFNTILQGTPGVGPIIQIPVNEFAKGRPELEDSLRFVLPFGVTQSTWDMLLPATLRRMKTRAGGEEDRIYRNQLMRIYWDEQVNYNLNKRADMPTYAEAKKKTDAFYSVRTIASFVSPAAPSFQSPYQPYIDAYRALVEKDQDQDRNAPGYRSPDEIFLETYGDDFFPLTQSLSKTMDGIPPTLEGAAARQRYVDLIEKHPELGGLIVGAEGAGEFSSAVYQSQLQKPLKPGAADKQRQAFSFEDAQAKPNERLGWMEYSKAMDIIDAERMNRGLPNLQVRAAKDLADLKRGVIANLERKYPEWSAVFNVTDRGAWARKIEGMRDIAADDRLAGRPEIATLRQYLNTRDQVIDILAARKAAGGASTITAAGNMDLKGVWDQITGQMTDNPAFASLFYRYLERDPLELDTGRVTALEVS